MILRAAAASGLGSCAWACSWPRTCPTAADATSASGISRISTHGARQPINTSASPAISRPAPPPAPPCASAAEPIAKGTMIANFEMISANSTSTVRIAQTRRAGHTIAQNTSGSISTTT